MLELDDDKSTKEVYSSGPGFYRALVKASSCSERRKDDDSWKSKLRFLTPDFRRSFTQHGSAPQPSEELQHCWCARNGYQTFTGPETFRLRLTSLDEVTECSHYVAISYCWRSAASAATEDGDKYIDIITSDGIRENRAPYGLIKRAIAYAAYRRLPFIWIDQECIEQDDEAEKQSIIEHMDRIFRQARHVVALTTATVCELQDLSTISALEAGHYTKVEPPAAQSLAELLANDDWFDRAWTLQENVLSARMIDFLLPLSTSIQNSLEYRQVMVGGYDALITQAMAFDLTHGEHNVRPSLTEKLAQGCTSYKREGPVSTSDLSRHRLSAFHSLSYLTEKMLSVPSDRLSIVANMSAFRVRINYLPAQSLGLDVATCVFAQALLNGDMSLILAYRFFLDPEDKEDPSLLRVSSSYSLSSAMQGWPTEEHRYSADFRCRILPLSIESQGFRAHGQLWTKQQVLDLPTIIQVFGLTGLLPADEVVCAGECLTAALRILCCLASKDDGPSALLMYWSLRLAEVDPWSHHCRPWNGGHKIDPMLAHFLTKPSTISDGDIAEFTSHLEFLFGMLFGHGRSVLSYECHLRRLLSNGRIHVYAQEAIKDGFNVPVILWNENAKPAPQALFVPNRVLMDGESVPQSILVWTVQERKNHAMPQLVLLDHLPRKIPAEPARNASSAPFFGRAVSANGDWSSIVAGGFGQDFLLKFK